jgi:hypothetical protein
MVRAHYRPPPFLATDLPLTVYNAQIDSYDVPNLVTQMFIGFIGEHDLSAPAR